MFTDKGGGMRIALDYRHPTPSHCDVAVFINGALAGVLTMRQEEIGHFQHIVWTGMQMSDDKFSATGNPDPNPKGIHHEEGT
jgi:hypothetical protein